MRKRATILWTTESGQRDSTVMLVGGSNQAPLLRILCAEDDVRVGEMMLLLLSQTGYEVEHCADGMTAWNRMAKELTYFDVLITDNQMPEMSGLELVTRLRQAKYQGRIIVHSGALSAKDEAGFRTMGVDFVIAKAMPPEVLLTAVESLIRR